MADASPRIDALSPGSTATSSGSGTPRPASLDTAFSPQAPKSTAKRKSITFNETVLVVRFNHSPGEGSTDAARAK